MMSAATIHLWSIDLDAAETYRTPFGSALTADERARANRFHFADHQRRWIAARQGLRAILGPYIAESPQNIRFAQGEHGKPRLLARANTPTLFFNLSHSDKIALLAITHIDDVGVDVEMHKENPDLDLTARHHFSSNELQSLASLPPNQKIPGFFRCWTRKEAYLKALGCGLSHPLDAFDVSLSADEPARIIAIENDRDRARRWSLFDLDVPPGYSGALAIQSTAVEIIRYFQFPKSAHPQKCS